MRAVVAVLALVAALALPAAAIPIVTDYTVTSGTYTGCATCPQAVTGTVQVSYDPEVLSGGWYTFTVRLTDPALPSSLRGPYTLGGPPDLTYATGVSPFGFTFLEYVAPETVHFNVRDNACTITSCPREVDVFASAVPEPGTLLLVALGLPGLAACRREGSTLRSA
jgi:hypothetical protein